jgi:hypothetical protein
MIQALKESPPHIPNCAGTPVTADRDIMDIVLALLMAYVLGGSIWPQIVRSRQMFLMGAGVVVLAMILRIFPVYFPTRLAETAAFVLLVLAGSGSSIQEWRQQIFG